MTSRLRMFSPLCLASVALVLALAPASASALGPVLAAPDLVYGTVVSLEPRVVPDTGVVVTDVRVVESRPGGGTELTRFTMQGGEVGDVGMWSEQFTDLSVGDSVVARVGERDGEVAAVAAPMVEGGVGVSDASGAGLLVDGIAAGYAQNGVHWSDASLPVPYYVNPSGLPETAPAAIAAGAQTWEDDPGSYMDFTNRGSTSKAPGVGDSTSVVGAGAVSITGAIAECSVWYNPATLRITEFDIAFNVGSYSFATDGRSSAFDVQGIGTHELGHTLHLLDLYDTENADQVMCGYGSLGDTGQRTLKWGDIAGIRSIYPGGGNSSPVAVANSYSTPEDTLLTVAASGVLANDTDADGDALSAGVVAGVSHGTLTLSANGSFTYRPAANYSGADSFTYRASDGSAYSNTVTVSITVTAVNDAPVARADSYSTPEGTVLTVAPAGVLANDTDAEGNALSVGLVAGALHGTVTLDADGSFTYTPAPGYSGSDSFTYRASDGGAYSNTVTVSIAVAAAGPAPVALDDVATVAENDVVFVAAPGVLGNDTDAGGSPLTAGLVTDTAHGMLTLLTDGSFAYAPNAGASGTDTFTYRAFNGVAYSAPATVTITIVPPDTTAPLTTSDATSYYAGSATIALTAADNPGGSGVAHTYYRLNGAAPVEGSTVTRSAAGSYTLAYWSVDERDNAETPHTLVFTVIARPSSGGTPSTPAPIPTRVHGRAFTVSGYIVKHTSGTSPVTLRFYRYKSGRWVYYKSTSAKASTFLTFSKYSDSTSVPYAGKWRVRARHKVGTKYLYSSYRSFTAS